MGEEDCFGDDDNDGSRGDDGGAIGVAGTVGEGRVSSSLPCRFIEYDG